MPSPPPCSSRSRCSPEPARRYERPKSTLPPRYEPDKAQATVVSPSGSSMSRSTAQDAICSSVAPTKHSSQTPTGPPPKRTAGPNVRQVIGRAAYRSQVPVEGSSAGHGSSSDSGRAADSLARAWTRAATSGSNRFHPRRSRSASLCVIGKGPRQHWKHPGRQASQSPAFREASASAASTI